MSAPRNLGAVDYASGRGPAAYRCGKCGRDQVKLWRDYQTFLNSQFLTCGECTKRQAGKSGVIDAKGMLDDRGYGPSDSIGGKVPAVPTEDGSTYWGYTSVPHDGVEWWRALPL